MLKKMHFKACVVSYITALFAILLIFTGCDAYADGSEKGDKLTGKDASVSKICDGMGVGRDEAEEIYRLICESGLSEKIRYITSWSDGDNQKYYRVRAYDGNKREVYLSEGTVFLIKDGDTVYYDVTAHGNTETTDDTEHIIETVPDCTDTSANDPDISEPAEDTAFAEIEIVLNKNSKKYHYPGCRSIEQISEGNRETIHVSDISELFDMGYSPCGICAKGDSRNS